VPLNIDHEIEVLKSKCWRIDLVRGPDDFYVEAISDYGSSNADGKKSVSYGVLFEKTVDTRQCPLIVGLILGLTLSIVEALNGTLRAAKRQKKVRFAARYICLTADAGLALGCV
jgi:Costars